MKKSKRIKAVSIVLAALMSVSAICSATIVSHAAPKYDIDNGENIKVTFDGKSVGMEDTSIQYTYTGKAITPKVVVKGDTTPYGSRRTWVTLKEGTDYTLKFSDNKNVGFAVATIKGKGNWTGHDCRYFSIAPNHTPTIVDYSVNKTGITFKLKNKTPKGDACDAGAHINIFKGDTKVTSKEKITYDEYDEKANAKVYTVKISGLKANTKYEARLHTMYRNTWERRMLSAPKVNKITFYTPKK